VELFVEDTTAEELEVKGKSSTSRVGNSRKSVEVELSQKNRTISRWLHTLTTHIISSLKN